MNIKSLLLGSAAALVAVSGARAADVIVPVAAEPADYVRICDVYGAGFYYIPGTETCLQISGYARLQYSVVGEQRNSEGDDYTAGTQVRGRLNFDAREETDLGTLRAFLRLQATNRYGKSSGFFNDGRTATGEVRRAPFGSGGSADGNVEMDLAYLQLGGLTIGYLDSLWAERDGLLTDTDWSVGDFQANRISYTFAADGFSAAVSLEDDGTGDFAPDVVGQLAYEGGWGSAYISGVYDEQGEIVTGTFTRFGINPLTGVAFVPVSFFANPFEDDDDGAFAVKGGISLKDLVATDSTFKVEGHYAFDPTIYATNSIVTTFGGIGRQIDNISIPIEYQVGAAYKQGFGKLTLGLSGVYGETFDLFTGAGTVASPFVNRGSADYYALAFNAEYEIVKNFDVLAEISYRDVGLNDGTAVFDDFDQTAGFIRFTRGF